MKEGHARDACVDGTRRCEYMLKTKGSWLAANGVAMVMRSCVLTVVRQTARFPLSLVTTATPPAYHHTIAANPCQRLNKLRPRNAPRDGTSNAPVSSSQNHFPTVYCAATLESTSQEVKLFESIHATAPSKQPSLGNPRALPVQGRQTRYGSLELHVSATAIAMSQILTSRQAEEL
jgi:hypothetical protein